MSQRECVSTLLNSHKKNVAFNACSLYFHFCIAAHLQLQVRKNKKKECNIQFQIKYASFKVSSGTKTKLSV